MPKKRYKGFANMKLTIAGLKRIIKEEKSRFLLESFRWPRWADDVMAEIEGLFQHEYAQFVWVPKKKRGDKKEIFFVHGETEEPSEGSDFYEDYRTYSVSRKTSKGEDIIARGLSADQVIVIMKSEFVDQDGSFQVYFSDGY
jgi:hypothetical protein